MGLFKKKQDTMSVTMAIVQALMDNDEVATNQAAAAASRLSAADIFANLGDFYATLARDVKPEQKQIMRDEISATQGPPELVSAVREIGTALIVDVDGHAAAAAINRHGRALADRSDNLWAGVMMETMDAAARINNRLDIKLSWR